MRIKIKFTRNTEPVTRTQTHITSWLHRVLGNNNKFHDTQSNFSLSPLLGGTLIDPKTENFKRGSYIVVSSNDIGFINQFTTQVMKHSFGFGMDFDGIEFMGEPNYMNDHFYVRTCKNGLVVKIENNKYLTYKDGNFIEVLVDKTKRKLKAISSEIDLSNFGLEVIESSTNRNINVVFHNFKVNTSDITLKITGNKEIFELLYNYGVGNMTGCGFGMVFPTQKWEEYNKY